MLARLITVVRRMAVRKVVDEDFCQSCETISIHAFKIMIAASYLVCQSVQELYTQNHNQQSECHDHK